MERAPAVIPGPQTRDLASGNPDPGLIVRFFATSIAFPLTDPGQSSTFSHRTHNASPLAVQQGVIPAARMSGRERLQNEWRYISTFVSSTYHDICARIHRISATLGLEEESVAA